VLLVLEEGDGGRGVVEVPGEAAIVEVDDLHRVAVDQEIGEAHVAVDQPEAVGSLAERLQPPADQRHGAGEGGRRQGSILHGRSRSELTDARRGGGARIGAL